MPRKRTQSPSSHPGPVLAERDAATYIGMSRDYLRAARQGRGSAGPDYVRAGRAIRYRVSALDAWLDAHTIRGTQGRVSDQATQGA